jgi:hypothetical protein
MTSRTRKVLTVALIAVAGLSFSGCVKIVTSNSPKVNTGNNVATPAVSKRAALHANMSVEEKEQAHTLVMRKVGQDVKANSRYKKMDLLKPVDNRSWFKELTFQLWDGEISKNQFVTSGLEFYPNNKYEFNFIANSILTK